MKILVEYTDQMIRQLIVDDMNRKLNRDEISGTVQSDLKIEVQSKQNYRLHTWEEGMLRCRLEVNV